MHRGAERPRLPRRLPPLPALGAPAALAAASPCLLPWAARVRLRCSPPGSSLRGLLASGRLCQLQTLTTAGTHVCRPCHLRRRRRRRHRRRRQPGRKSARGRACASTAVRGTPPLPPPPPPSPLRTPWRAFRPVVALSQHTMVLAPPAHRTLLTGEYETILTCGLSRRLHCGPLAPAPSVPCLAACTPPPRPPAHGLLA